MAHITTLTRAYDDLHNSQANTYSYSGSFETFKESEVKVKLNDTPLTYNSSPSDATQYSVNLTDKTIHVGGGNLTSGTLSIYPETDLGAPTLKAPYTAGSAITASDLTNNQKQVMRKILEHKETKLNNTGGTMTGDLTMGEDRNIIFEGATDNAHETTITVADPTADRTITFPNVTGNVVTTGDDGTVTSTMITNNTIVDADVNSSAAIAGTKISPNFGGQNIVTTGSLTVGSTLAVTGAIDFNGGANIDNIQIGVTDDNEIDTASGNLTIDSAGGTVTIDDALAVTGGASLNSTLGVTGTSTLSNITGGAVVTSGTSTSDTKVYSAKRAGEIFYGKGTVEEIQSGETWSAADDKVATTAAIDARIIDLVDDVGGFVPIANELSFPNANPDVNNGAGTLVSIKGLSQNLTSNGSGQISISNGTVGNSTVTITGADNSTTYATGFGMIVETTTTLNTYTFHRLVPKATEVTAVVGNATNINTVATNINNVNTVAGDTTEINALAAKTTELGLLGTSAVVTDLSILGTADVVADLNTLGTADVVADMNMLATSDVVADMALLATTDVISDMNTLAVSGVISDMDTIATNLTNVNNVGNSISSVNTAASNLTSINNFGDKYQVAANNPTTDGGGNALAAGDLYFNTSANELKVYNGSSWQGGVTATGSFAATTGNTFTGDNVYNDNVKLKLGTGSDFEIYFNGTNTSLYTNTGDITIQTAGDDIELLANDDIQLKVAGGVETSVNCIGHGAVELYYDNSKKLETTSTGVNVTGDLVTSDDVIINGGASDESVLRFRDGGTESWMLRQTNSDNILAFRRNSTNYLTLQANGNVDVANGLDVTGNITVTGTVDGVDIAALSSTVAGITTDVLSDTSPQLGGDLDTNSHHILLDDGHAVKWGDGTDLEIQHTGSYAHTHNSEGNYIIDSTGSFYVRDTIGSKTAILADPSGSTELYHNNTKQFETTSTGVTIYNGVIPSPNKSVAIGNDSNRLSHIYVGDDRKIYLGDSNDLQLYHDGSNSYLTNSTGTLLLQNSGQTTIKGSTVQFENAAGSEVLLKAVQDGAVELYHDNSKKFETYANGIYSHGNLNFTNDSSKIYMGAGDDLQIYHNGTHNYIDSINGNLYLRVNSTENAIKCTQNGNVEISYDGNKKLETTGAGIDVTGSVICDGFTSSGADVAFNSGTTNANILFDASDLALEFDDSVKATFGFDQDLQIYHSGSANYIDGGTFATELISDDLRLRSKTGNETYINADVNGAVELYHDNSKKFETTSTGVQVNDWITLGGTGGIRSDNAVVIEDAGGNEWRAKFHDNSSCEFAYDNVKKLETTSGGINVVGAITVNGSALGSGGLISTDSDSGYLTSGDQSLSSSYSEIMELQITPSSSSNKVAIFSSMALQTNGSNSWGGPAANHKITRTVGSTTTTLIDQNILYQRDNVYAAKYLLAPSSIDYMDSPNTTSQVTYKIYAKYSDTAGSGSVKSYTSIAMEVAV